MRGSGAEESISLPPGYVCIKGWRGGLHGLQVNTKTQTQESRHKDDGWLRELLFVCSVLSPSRLFAWLISCLRQSRDLSDLQSSVL